MEGIVSNSPIDLAVEVLHYLAEHSGEHGVRELAGKLQRGKSTVQRTLAALEAWSLVTLNPRTEKYSLGPGILRLAAGYFQDRSLSVRSLPAMQWLRDRSGETVTLSVAANGRVIPIQQVESLHDLRWVSRIGHPLPIHAGATAKCLLAQMPDPWLDEFLAGGELERYTPLTITDPGAIRAEVQRIRQQGYAMSFGEWGAGSAAIAVPVATREAGGPVALGLLGPTARLTEARMLELLPDLRQAAAAITAGLLMMPAEDRQETDGRSARRRKRKEA